MTKQALYVERRNDDAVSHRYKMAQSINQLQDIINSVNEITLDTGTVRSQFSSRGINSGSYVGFTPKNANSANELYSGGMYIDTVSTTNSTYDIVHSSTSTAVFVFNTVIIG